MQDTRPDKRGKWTKRELRKVWEHYIKSERFIKRFKPAALEEVDLNQVAPCHACGKLMFRTQYIGEQPKGKNSWDIFHLNGDFLNNQSYNLEPMHPECIAKKTQEN